MPRAQWPLLGGKPVVPIILPLPSPGQSLSRNLLADTGAGSMHIGFDILLDKSDCVLCGGSSAQQVVLGGFYTGTFPVYVLRVRIPALGFDQDVRAVAVPTTPKGLAGIAGFRFLNQFTYGNFGDPTQFGLEL